MATPKRKAKKQGIDGAIEELAQLRAAEERKAKRKVAKRLDEVKPLTLTPDQEKTARKLTRKAKKAEKSSKRKAAKKTAPRARKATPRRAAPRTARKTAKRAAPRAKAKAPTVTRRSGRVLTIEVPCGGRYRLTPVKTKGARK